MLKFSNRILMLILRLPVIHFSLDAWRLVNCGKCFDNERQTHYYCVLQFNKSGVYCNPMQVWFLLRILAMVSGAYQQLSLVFDNCMLITLKFKGLSLNDFQEKKAMST